MMRGGVERAMSSTSRDRRTKARDHLRAHGVEAGAAGARSAPFSARVTTPTGTETDAVTFAGHRASAAHPDDLGRAAADIEYQRALYRRPISGAQPIRRQIGFFLGVMTSARYRFRRGRGRQDSRHCAASRAAWVAMARTCSTPFCADVLGADLSAAMVRSMAASDSRPRLRHPLAQPHDAGEGIHDPEAAAALAGAAISRRQLLVPRSSTAKRRAGWRLRRLRVHHWRPLRAFSPAPAHDFETQASMCRTVGHAGPPPCKRWRVR